MPKRKSTTPTPSPASGKKAKVNETVAPSTNMKGSSAKLTVRGKSSKNGRKTGDRHRHAGSFYQTGSGTTPVPPLQQNLNKLFDQYRDNPKAAPDKIGIEGAQKYLTDLNVELDEVAHLAICDLLQCPSIGEFDREPFVSGWRSVSTGDKPYDSVARQAQYIDVIRKRLSTDTNYFKQVYRNAFKLAKPEGQRSVPMDSAIDFWNMFFRQGKGGIEWNTTSTKWLDLWCEFYESHSKRPVNKDLWNMVGELVLRTKQPGGESFDWWTEDGAWPMAIDEYVAFMKKRNGDGDSMDTS